ncbi:MAG: AFG1 family ATPase [Gammaproteobacteria bacterium]|nr:AFG1 family ATPase [Gammaproteobacteria bacterium]
MASPQELYEHELENKLMLPDEAQRAVVGHLQSLYEALIRLPEDSAPAGLSDRLLGRLRNRRKANASVKAPPGLYLWGGVGSGKTHLCDMFYKAVPIEKKLRMHYHRFMLLVHHDLNDMQAVADPLDRITANWAEKVRLLVLDEMHINDITDAMLMRNLLDGLYKRGVVLVTTSNRPPDDLYHDGLQREQFLPAIALLKRHSRVLKLDTEQDYRLRALEHTETYLTPLDETVETKLEASFEELSGHDEEQLRTGTAIINDREIPIVKRAAGVIWFDFDALCNSPRSNRDYIEITNYFHTVIISDVPVMDKQFEDAARRFVNMIDEFYDHNTNLIIAAAAPPEQLYTGEKLEFEFQRAVSRLREMQSQEYFARERLLE